MHRIVLVVLLLLPLSIAAQTRLECASGATDCDLSHGIGGSLTFKSTLVPIEFVLDNVATAQPHPRSLGNQALQNTSGGLFRCTAFGTVTPVSCALDVQECPAASGGVTGCASILSGNLVLTALNAAPVTQTITDTSWAVGAFLKVVPVSGSCSEVTVCRLIGQTVP